MNTRKSFAFMLDWIPVFELLDIKEEYDEVFEAIRAVLNNQEPVVVRPKSKKAWEFIEPKLRENTIKYEEAKAKKLEALRKYNEKRHANDTTTSSQHNDNETLTSRKRDDNGTTNDSVTVTDTVTDTVTVTVTDTVTGNRKENSKEKRFVKPKLEEIERFIVDNGYDVDGETFFDFYEAKGWKIGKAPMKDWRAAVRNWHRKNVTVTNGVNAIAKNDFLAAYDRGELT